MGRPIAQALAAHGPVVVYDVRESALVEARAAGLSVAGSLGELAATCSTVLLSLPGPAEVGFGGSPTSSPAGQPHSCSIRARSGRNRREPTASSLTRPGPST